MNFATGDTKGYIYEKDGAICRVHTGTDCTYPQKIFSLYRQHDLKRFGVIETTLQQDGTFLHPLLPLTYPHEWCPSMFKDAVLFHLDLLLILAKVGLTLKDALPENILFLHGRPILVDFFSLIPQEDLEKEPCLPSHDKRHSILDSMFVPYMLAPLILYARGHFEAGRRLLTENFCNNTKAELAPSQKLTKPSVWQRFKLALNVLADHNPSNNALVVQRVVSLLYGKRSSWLDDIRALRPLVASLDVTMSSSAYIDYYQMKKEDFPLWQRDCWLEKQQGYAQALELCQPKTLLELGGNTGWFPRLAVINGAEVISTDIEVACVEHMYRYARCTNEPIMPLWLSFDGLSEECYSLDGHGKRQKYPFHMAATKRLSCEMVSCLGLLHHLTLGLGKSFTEIAKVLRSLCQKSLLIEFVALDDVLIHENPDFFPNLNQWNPSTYSIDTMLKAFKPFFHLQQIFPSTPAKSRTLLLLDVIKKQ